MPPFNYSILRLNRVIARSLPYQGVVVDLGCGEAPYRDEILRSARTYIGVDWPASLHDRSKVDLVADLSAGVPLTTASVDTVVCFQSLEHVKEPSRLLVECHRILRPGGRLLVTVPFMWHIHEEPNDYYRFTRFGLAYLLEQAGFDQIRIRENTGFWQMWVLKFNYHTRRFSVGPLKLLFVPLWWVGQELACFLDARDPSPEETASYTVSAEKRAGSV